MLHQYLLKMSEPPLGISMEFSQKVAFLEECMVFQNLGELKGPDGGSCDMVNFTNSVSDLILM
jgi:hypothetical protein